MSPHNHHEPTAKVTTKHRWIVLGFLFVVTLINFIDRQTLSVLAPVIRDTFHLSNAQYGRIVSALQFGMMAGEFPMGCLMDRLGVRIGLSFAVLWWSAATGAQVLARNGLTFGFTRFWMGTGECGNFSGGIKTVGQLFDKKERTLAIGIFNSGSVIGATIAPPLIVYLLHHYGFRTAFLVPAMFGLLWAPLWWIVYGREQRRDESIRLNTVSLPSMLRDSSTWAVMMCRFWIGPVMQFYWYWIPSYLVNARHITMTQVGMLAWIPFFFGDIGSVGGGWAARILQSRGVPTAQMRRILMFSSAFICMVSLFVPHIASIGFTLVVLGIAIAADNFLSAHMFAAVTDLFPDPKVGRASGLMGVAGGLGGLLFPLLTGFLVDRISYKPVFLMVAFMPLVGTLFLFALGRRYRTLEAQPISD